MISISRLSPTLTKYEPKLHLTSGNLKEVSMYGGSVCSVYFLQPMLVFVIAVFG